MDRYLYPALRAREICPSKAHIFTQAGPNMIWHVLLHAIGVFFIITFTFVNITAVVLDIGLTFFNAIAAVLVRAVFALLSAIVDGFNGVVDAPHQVRSIRDNSRQLSPGGIAFLLHNDNYNNDSSEEHEDGDDESDYNPPPAVGRAPAPDVGRRPDTEQQRRISPRTLGPDGRVQGEAAPPPIDPGPLFPTRRRTMNDGQRRRRGAVDHGRPDHIETTTANVNREPAQPMDIPGTERGRRHTIPGTSPPDDDEDILLVGRPPRPPGPLELRSSPETARISRAYRQGQPLPVFEQRHRNEQSPSPTYVRLRTVNTATGQAHEAPRHVSDHAIIEQGDAVSDTGTAEGSADGGRSRSHEAHQTAGAEADETDTGRSQETSQEQTDTATDLRRLAAVLNSRAPRQQDPEVRMVIRVPEPREIVPEKAHETLEAQAAQAITTSEANQATEPVSESSTPTAAPDSSGQPQTPQNTRDRRHMRATITQATNRRLRASTESQGSPPSTRLPSSGSTISDRPFVRSNSPSPPSPLTPTPRRRRRSWPQRQTVGANSEANNDGFNGGDDGQAKDTDDTPESQTGSMPGAGQDNDEAAE